MKNSARVQLITILFIIIVDPVFAVSEDSTFNAYFRKDIGGWIAGDATYSIDLPDGKTLWLFGDSFIGEVEPDNSIKPGAAFIRNSCVLQQGEEFISLYGGTPENPETYFLTDNPDSTWYWPEHGIVSSDSLFIFLAKYRKGEGPSGFNFEFAGNDIACYSYPDMQLDTIIELPFHPANGVIYGDRILEYQDMYYIYGRKEEVPEFKIPYPHVARTRNIFNPDSWEFFNGSDWSPEPSVSKRINDFQVSQQYGIFSHENKYILLTQDIWFSQEIWSFTAESPVGPWKNKTLLYTTPHPFEDMFTYNAYPHPQFNDRNECLVSYNSNGDFFTIFQNVELYRPRFIRIPFKDIDPDFDTDTVPSSIASQKISGIPVSNYPNPCRSGTTISYELAIAGNVKIMLSSLAGKVLETYTNNYQEAGSHRIEIRVSDFPDGIYIYTVEAPGYFGRGRFVKLSGME